MKKYLAHITYFLYYSTYTITIGNFRSNYDRNNYANYKPKNVATIRVAGEHTGCAGVELGKF